jgi:NAD(P)-dependent dehydrogenase (short-subunit alcohol dehydrogenase family)
MAATFSTAYSTSKWALRGLSKSAAYNLAGWGISCTTIQPGMIETDMTKDIAANPMAERTISESILLARIDKADEIAKTALFLASDDSSYITAEEIVVGGGWYSAGPYLTNDRRNHMTEMLQKKMSIIGNQQG